MEIIQRKIKGVFEINPAPIVDSRGYFMRTYDDKIFNEAGINFNWVQENQSRSYVKGTIRGLHFQLPPYGETKLIRCIRGKILDVFVDLRKDSLTFGKWDSLELSEDNYKMILLPRGIAHGFCTLVDESYLFYKHDNYYHPESYSGIIWNDPDLNIQWPLTDVFISDKDKNLMSFRKFNNLYQGI